MLTTLFFLKNINFKHWVTRNSFFYPSAIVQCDPLFFSPGIHSDLEIPGETWAHGCLSTTFLTAAAPGMKGKVMAFMLVLMLQARSVLCGVDVFMWVNVSDLCYWCRKSQGNTHTPRLHTFLFTCRWEFQPTKCSPAPIPSCKEMWLMSKMTVLCYSSLF